ncbi:hypothetical protein OC835_001462 [Tilletia horrida]|nr:hypothetical protein OC835_001462 [Tilletia horrida]
MADDEPPQDEPPQDEPPQDEPPQDEPPQDEPPQDEPPQDEPPQDEPPQGLEAADDDNGGYPSDQAEEHNSTPEDNSSTSASSDEASQADACSDASQSSDGSDDGADMADFVVEGQVPDSSQSIPSSEASAQFTNSSQDIADDDGDAALEQQMAEDDPDGAYVPEGEEDTEIIIVDEDGDEDEEEAAEADGSDQVDDGEEEAAEADGSDQVDDGEEEAAVADGDEDEVVAAADHGEGDDEDDLGAETGHEVDAHGEDDGDEESAEADAQGEVEASTGAQAAQLEDDGFVILGVKRQAPTDAQHDGAKRVKHEPLPPAVKMIKVEVQARVVCEWIHDDTGAAPLSEWTHAGQAGPSKPGLRHLPARLVDVGGAKLPQFKFFNATWTWAHNVKLRRACVPPTCPGCREEDVVVLVERPETEIA